MQNLPAALVSPATYLHHVVTMVGNVLLPLTFICLVLFCTCYPENKIKGAFKLRVKARLHLDQKLWFCVFLEAVWKWGESRIESSAEWTFLWFWGSKWCCGVCVGEAASLREPRLQLTRWTGVKSHVCCKNSVFHIWLWKGKGEEQGMEVNVLLF